MPAPAPSRSTAKLTLTIGVIPLALDVFSATQESATTRSMYVRQGDQLNKVGMNTYDTITGKNVERDQVLKCVETTEGDLVEISDEEMQNILSAENGTCTFIGFLKLDDFEYSIETQYQIRPQRTKTKNNPYEKPFALILQSMADTGTVGLLSFVARGKTKYAAIDHTGGMVTLRFDEEVREQRPIATPELSDQELALGKALVAKMILDEAPVFHDEDSAKIAEFAAEKAKATAAGNILLAMPPVEDKPKPADDLMALLAASVNA